MTDEKNDAKSTRKTAIFYHTMSELADAVRILFSVFIAPYILNHVKKTLDLLHSANDTFAGDRAVISHRIILNVLTTTSKSFLYDENGLFASKERILLVNSSIINQVRTFDDIYQELNEIIVYILH